MKMSTKGDYKQYDNTADFEHSLKLWESLQNRFKYWDLVSFK